MGGVRLKESAVCDSSMPCHPSCFHYNGVIKNTSKLMKSAVDSAGSS